MVEIVKIDTSDKSQVNRFIQLEFDLYRGNKVWVPPLWPDARAQLDRRRHPYYQHSDADFFIAVKDGRDVGRIALLDNRAYNDYRHEKTAFFYLFACTDDLDVSRALFRKAEAWAKEKGMDKLFGPKGFLTLDAFGILVEGFEYLPAMGVLYNEPYYERLMTDWGFEKFTDVYSCYFSGVINVEERYYKIADRVAARGVLSIRKFKNKKEIIDILPKIMEAYNRTFIHNWEFYPLSPQEISFIASRLIDVIRPELIKLVMKGDEIIGFLLGFPDVCEAIQKINGRLWPFGFLTLLRALKTTKRIDLNGVGVLPEFQGLGANTLLYTEMARTINDYGFTFADLVQMEEKNDKIQAELKTLGATFYKTHRLYQKHLE